MRIVFMGTPAFAVPTLERLLSSRHDVVGVVTQPDRRRGRGQHRSAGPVKQTAERHDLPLLQPERIRDAEVLETFSAWQPDIGVVAAYGKILPDDILALPRHGLINVHASLLPKYRGAAPIHRAVMAGETRTGITIIKLVRKMDAGPMLRSASLPIGDDQTSLELETELAPLGAELAVAALEDIDSGRAVLTEQDHEQATFAPRLTRADGLIDWRRPAPELHDQVRGLHPWPHAYSFLENRRLLIRRSSVTARPPSPDGRSPADGEIIVSSRDTLIVATGAAGALALPQVQVEGRRPVETRAFLAGHPIRRGAVFGTPDDPDA